MALIECYECAKQISDTASACPNCGAPAGGSKLNQHKYNKTRRVGIWLIIGNFLIPFIFYWPLLRDGYSKKARIIGAIWLALFTLSVLSDTPNNSVTTQSTFSSSKAMAYPTSTATYSIVDSEVGCKSTYSDQKKEDIFNERYKNQWMTWSGEIVLLESDEVSLNIDRAGTQDLKVEFTDKSAGYNLNKGDNITVKFLMKSAGGCFLPFSGEQATIN